MRSPPSLPRPIAVDPASGPWSGELQHWLDALPQPVWLARSDLELLSFNAALCRLLGQPSEALRKRRLSDWLPDGDAELLRQACAGREALALELRLRATDGHLRWQSCRASPLLLDGEPLWLGTLHDIDASHRAQARWEEADETWKLALESTGDGVWDWRLDRGVETFSRRYLEIYGYDPDEIEQRPETFDALTHPDDVEQMERDRQAHFEGRTPIYRNEHRVRCKDGRWKWVLSRGMVISRDAQGRPLRMVGTHTDITERKQAEALIWQHAHMDPLTGLPNRRLLRERLSQALNQHRPLAVLFIDLDHFKEVNDTLGHGKGDLLLQQAAQRIQDCLQPHDIVARMGGDEFTVVLQHRPDRAAVEQTVRRLLARVSEVYLLERERAFVSASLGISLYPDDGEHIETLFKHADQALYVAKDAGRNRFAYFTPELHRAALHRVRLGMDLREALQRRQLRLVYQPIVDLRSGALRKAEALLRWAHPERGEVSPAEFIPIAETSGLILEIGEWLFDEALRTLVHWRRKGLSDLRLSLNKSPLQFLGAGDGPQRWLARLAEHGLPPQALTLEITEGLLLEGGEAVSAQLNALREAGIKLALDDFGTGYSSLAYLQRHRIDAIKIDRSFVHELAPHSRALALCRTIVSLAHELGMEVIAEGVETPEQLELLRAMGCDMGQGFLFARPLEAADLPRWLAERPARP
ncbi:EAL domain-containing protein [Pelomonas sp. CA6]|uniref:putative bifunctional diguanylate cyclase/phosphodiesterase n=1 Tax=Pelomonas sp. CA6 TaxID=2907999 RepID=UPI001F4C5120|nr:GGDEF and EAL domain-containing protein [Pelomonas sp. CA6]MCH7345907.1 EAL domain-containing protein [Pelomonas sp. CA6]